MKNVMDSMDKMIELGMGVALANQVVSTIGKSISQMQVPITNQSTSQTSDNVYYIVIDEKQAGPYTLSEILDLLKSKKIAKETYVWKPGMQQWELAENINTIKPFL